MVRRGESGNARHRYALCRSRYPRAKRCKACPFVQVISPWKRLGETRRVALVTPLSVTRFVRHVLSAKVHSLFLRRRRSGGTRSGLPTHDNYSGHRYTRLVSRLVTTYPNGAERLPWEYFSFHVVVSASRWAAGKNGRIMRLGKI